MDVLTFYILACIPFFVGAGLWLWKHQVVWQEWIGGTVLGFVLAAIMHLLSTLGQTGDVETWSGHVIKAVHYPRWVEEYQQMHTTTVSDGRGGSTTITYFTTEYRTHHEHWEAYSNIDSEIGISQAKYHEMVREFGPSPPERPNKSGFSSGDRNVYPTYNRTRGELYPVTKLVSFENKIKATPTTFSFPKVPPAIRVYPYPSNNDPWRSDRLIGTAATLDTYLFDQMSARLGPRKKVNLILVGFGNSDSSMAEWQQAAWIGGKKNDVVICWGGLNRSPTWVKAFGWTDKKMCLRALESIILEEGMLNSTLPSIEREIIASYEKKDWDKSFAHIRVPAPMWSIWTYIVLAIAGQTFFWLWAHSNDHSKFPASGMDWLRPASSRWVRR